jgi:hypothetical protein
MPGYVQQSVAVVEKRLKPVPKWGAWAYISVQTNGAAPMQAIYGMSRRPRRAFDPDHGWPEVAYLRRLAVDAISGNV